MMAGKPLCMTVIFVGLVASIPPDRDGGRVRASSDHGPSRCAGERACKIARWRAGADVLSVRSRRVIAAQPTARPGIDRSSIVRLVLQANPMLWPLAICSIVTSVMSWRGPWPCVANG